MEPESSSTAQAGFLDPKVVAEDIRKTWQAIVVASVEGYVRVGQRLLDMRREQDDEVAFETWVKAEKFQFSVRTAQRLIAIAENDVLNNATHASQLPPRWATLYELSRLSEEVLKAKITGGEVTPRTTRRDVAKMLELPANRKINPKAKKAKKAKPKSLRLEQEGADRLRKSTVAAINKLVAVDPTNIADTSVWVSEMIDAIMKLEDFCTQLCSPMPVTATVAPPLDVVISHQAQAQAAVQQA
jgi:hypothetical protein